MNNRTDDSQKKQLYIRNGIPISHHLIETEIGHQKISGAVWDKQDIHADDGIHLYKEWPKVMFANPWYSIESNSVTNEKATQRDISILENLLGNDFLNPSMIIDVHCGSGRHAIALAKKGHKVIGMEEIKLPLEMARENAKQQYVKVTFVQTTPQNYKKYKATANLVISMFNSLGYTFNREDDLHQLMWMIGLLKPNGYFILDIRSEDYQKKHFSLSPVKFKTVLPVYEYNTSLKVVITTQKYWHNNILGAKEKIVIEKEGHQKLVQYMTYGWRTYSIVELQDILDTAGAIIEDVKEDYYTSPENLGERVFILAKAK